MSIPIWVRAGCPQLCTDCGEWTDYATIKYSGEGYPYCPYCYHDILNGKYWGGGPVKGYMTEGYARDLFDQLRQWGISWTEARDWVEMGIAEDWLSQKRIELLSK
jgi:hypothetical protein